MSSDPECIFCKIVAAQIPASIVFECEAAVSFLDISPLAEGHLLVVPRVHCNRLAELPADQLAGLAATLPDLVRAVQDVTGAPACNVLLNDGSEAGQVVAHVHFHIIPRRAGDGLGYRWNAGACAKERAAELVACYKNALGAG